VVLDALTGVFLKAEVDFALPTMRSRPPSSCRQASSPGERSYLALGGVGGLLLPRRQRKDFRRRGRDLGEGQQPADSVERPAFSARRSKLKRIWWIQVRQRDI
jgi:hypothetical protein